MADDLAPWLRDWQLSPCEHSSRTYPLACSPCLRDQLLGSDWLAAHDAEVAAQARADERERIAAAITSRINAETYGTESGVAWVGGWRAAISAAAQAARTPDPNGDNT